MKSFLTLMLVCASLTACNGTPQSPTAASAAASARQPSNPYQDPALALTTQQITPFKPDYTPATQPDIYYYNVSGVASEQPVADGYHRKILGTTADGRTVAQDFYESNQQPQTSPFIIMKNGDPKVFDKSVLDSDVIWYDQKTGDITSTATFQNGVQQGWLNVYEFNQLQLQLQDRDEGIDMRYFAPDEKIWGEARLRQNLNTGQLALENLTFFHPNGTILTQVEIDELGQPMGVKTFDSNGKMAKAADNAKLNELMLRRFALLMNKLPKLMAR